MLRKITLKLVHDVSDLMVYIGTSDILQCTMLCESEEQARAFACVMYKNAAWTDPREAYCIMNIEVNCPCVLRGM